MTDCAKKYTGLLDTLLKITVTSEKRLLKAESDRFFSENVNFLTKTYLIMLCVYLEAYLKDSFVCYVDYLNEVLKSVKLPQNLLRWSMSPKERLKDSACQYGDYTIGITRDDIDSFLSANPYRTQELFKFFGVNWENEDERLSTLYKDVIKQIVTLRNKIIHYNDDASNVSLGDVCTYIVQVKEYLSILDKIFARLMSSE